MHPMQQNPTRILIVKTSSLGDIIQSFHGLNYLKQKFPSVQIDWVVEEAIAPLVAAHPLVDRLIALNLSGVKKNWRKWLFWQNLFRAIRALRRQSYDVVFDLQGNSKSGLITWLARGRQKVGFGFRSVREWPNVLATRIRFDVPLKINIRLQHLRLLEQFFGDRFSETTLLPGVRFKMTPQEQQALDKILSYPELTFPFTIMVCPGSKWINKQLPQEVLSEVLQKIGITLNASFLLIWGTEEERVYCELIQRELADRSRVIDRLSIPTWQNLMNEVDFVFAVDSSALHLCGTSRTPSFSVFGPSRAEVFKPIGPSHFALQGACPYGKTFEKRCPILRSCPTGACIRGMKAEPIIEAFLSWKDSLGNDHVHGELDSSLGKPSI
jgi:heptosyltransferase-1